MTVCRDPRLFHTRVHARQTHSHTRGLQASLSVGMMVHTHLHASPHRASLLSPAGTRIHISSHSHTLPSDIERERTPPVIGSVSSALCLSAVAARSSGRTCGRGDGTATAVDLHTHTPAPTHLRISLIDKSSHWHNISEPLPAPISHWRPQPAISHSREQRRPRRLLRSRAKRRERTSRRHTFSAEVQAEAHTPSPPPRHGCAERLRRRL